MKDLRRLTEGAGTAFQRRLLESARYDASPEGSMSAVAARLGLELSAAELEGRPEDCSLPSEAGLKNAGSGALLKYSLIAIVCGSLGGSSTSGAALSNPASLTSAPLAASNSAQASSEPGATFAPEPAPTAPDDMAASDAADFDADEPAHAPAAKPRLPVAQSAAAAGAAQGRSSAPLPSRGEPRGGSSAAPADGLLAEVQKLDRVRAALAAFHSQAALDELDDYDRSFPRGELALEAIVLRVQALRSAGQFAPAARLARRALELPGIDRYRSRLARLIEPE